MTDMVFISICAVQSSFLDFCAVLLFTLLVWTHCTIHLLLLSEQNNADESSSVEVLMHQIGVASFVGGRKCVNPSHIWQTCVWHSVHVDRDYCLRIVWMLCMPLRTTTVLYAWDSVLPSVVFSSFGSQRM